MPLRDHFRPPVSKRHSWDALHALWPMAIVQQLRNQLPEGFIAEPRVFLGGSDDPIVPREFPPFASTTPEPMFEIETDAPDDEYAVRVYDEDHARTLVARIEIVSLFNKERAEQRSAFVAKCAALARSGVAVTIVDPVVVSHFNLFAELMSALGHGGEGPMSADAPPIYAASLRWVPRGARAVLQTWPSALAVGEALPTLPLWLAPEVSVALDLERSYESACHSLWIA
jgi:hypothetical protein